MPTRRIVLARAAAGVALPFATLPSTTRAAEAPEMPKPGMRDWSAQMPTVRVGILGGENEGDRLVRFDGYQKLLQDTFKVPVKLVLASDYAGAIQAFAAHQLDISLMSPAAYAAAFIESDGDVAPILTTQEADGSTSYVSAMYVRADSGITDLAGLRGKAMAWADPNSASGYLIPRAEMREAGIEPDGYFSRTGFAGGAEQSVVAVLGGQYDAGLAWTSGRGDEAAGFTRGVFRAMVDKKMLDMAKLRIIWRSRPITNGPWVVRQSTPQGFRDDMLAFHAALAAAHPDIYRAVDKGTGLGWVPVRHADYQVFVDMLKREAAERRRRR